MKKIVVGILAHVDAGKTTLSESMLYLAGSIKKLGRVDHQDAFLDYDKQEKNRGITIFSKQAIIKWKDVEITIVDTPGHVDFSSEMERTLQILDYAIVVINGTNGIQPHSETIWQLLNHYQVPTLFFINKMDISHFSQDEIMKDIQNKLSENCLDFTKLNQEQYENLALIEDSLLDKYLNDGVIPNQDIALLVAKRKVFPCFFGSALKITGIDNFLDGLVQYTIEKEYPSNFGAKVFKITHDEQGNRLTHVKITGGTLKVKDKISENEKADQIRRYSGNKYEMLNEVDAGTICAIKGLKNIKVGQGLGFEASHTSSFLTSCMEYRVVLPDEYDTFVMVNQLKEFMEEDPQLHIRYNEKLDEIRIQLMGEIQTEILKNRIKERFHVDVEFDQGSVVYKETIVNTVEGVGHYEPLRHYAEVHLLMEPGPRDSGLQFFTNCKEEDLSRHFQRLVLSHLEEKEHLGVLTGSPITDMKITLVAGRAHIKHTEGGDFRQATYRAIRHGLKKAKSILLEPYYQFQLTVPNEQLSHAIYDIEQMNGQFEIEDNEGVSTTLKGKAPVALMQNYYAKVMQYTKGKGQFTYQLKGYEPCHNQETVIQAMGYNSEADLDNPTGSVFCAHGAGFNVPYDKVEEYMHIDYVWKPTVQKKVIKPTETTISQSNDEELEKIFTMTYGPAKRKLSSELDYVKHQEKREFIPSKPECLLVDGYNAIHAWPELKEIANENLDAARAKLIDIMSNYQGFKKCILIVVFDAYKVKGNIGSTQKYHNIYVTYTKEAQTADMYIERATHELGSKYNIVVATSDALEQLIVLGNGGRRISSRELKLEVEHLISEKMSEFERNNPKYHSFQMENIKNYHDK